MKLSPAFLAWSLLPITLFAWCGVVYFGWSILHAESEYIATLEAIQQSSVAQSSAVRMHAIIEETAPQRERLDKLLAVDVVSAAALLQSVGKKTGVTVKLSGALPESTASASAKGPKIQAIGFALQADGSFAALMRTAKLLEALPIPSSVERLDLQTSTAAGQPSGSWHMSVYVRVLTTTNISS